MPTPEGVIGGHTARLFLLVGCIIRAWGALIGPAAPKAKTGLWGFCLGMRVLGMLLEDRVIVMLPMVRCSMERDFAPNSGQMPLILVIVQQAAGVEEDATESAIGSQL